MFPHANTLEQPSGRVCVRVCVCVRACEEEEEEEEEEGEGVWVIGQLEALMPKVLKALWGNTVRH